MTTPGAKLQQLIAGAQLPALPQSAIRLLELSQNPSNGPEQFAAPIEADPGLTSQVLRFVNSSYFGLSRKIDNVRQAITLVGIRTIKNFALWSAVFTLMPNPKCGPFDLRCLWQDSLRRALFARIAGKHLGLKNPDDLFAASLLQDMAVPMLARDLNRQYEKLLDRRAESQERLSTLEQEAFGWSHAHVGGLMARIWHLPEEFAVLIEGHTDLQRHLAKNAGPGPVAVSLSSHLPSTVDQGWSEREVFRGACEKLFKSVDPADMLSQVDKEFNEFAPVLRINAPKKTLVECYGEPAVTV